MASRRQQHNQFSLQMGMAAYKAGDTVLGDKILKAVKKDLDQQAKYIDGLSDNKQDAMQYEMQDVQRTMMMAQQIEMQFKNAPVMPTEAPAQIKSAPVLTPKAADTPKKKG
jgi:hypothetical protein